MLTKTSGFNQNVIWIVPVKSVTPGDSTLTTSDQQILGNQIIIRRLVTEFLLKTMLVSYMVWMFNNMSLGWLDGSDSLTQMWQDHHREPRIWPQTHSDGFWTCVSLPQKENLTSYALRFKALVSSLDFYREQPNEDHRVKRHWKIPIRYLVSSLSVFP